MAAVDTRGSALPPGHRTLHACLRQKADREYKIPWSARRRVVAETLRDWLYAYRRGGFAALKPAPPARCRRDARLAAAVADQLCVLKEAHPALSVAMAVRHSRRSWVIHRLSR